MNNQKTLGIERLFMIAKLLEIDVAEILELNKQTIKFFNTLKHIKKNTQYTNNQNYNRETT